MRGQNEELLEPMDQAPSMVEDRFQGILAKWALGLTTTFTEGHNNLFSTVKCKTSGHLAVDYMTIMLYFVAGKLTLP